MTKYLITQAALNGLAGLLNIVIGDLPSCDQDLDESTSMAD